MFININQIKAFKCNKMQPLICSPCPSPSHHHHLPSISNTKFNKCKPHLHSLSSLHSSIPLRSPTSSSTHRLHQPQNQTRPAFTTFPISNSILSNSKTHMENPVKLESLYSIRDERRVWTHPSSPEFEFWMVRNPSVPQPNILSADELFVDGVLLPLDHLVSSKEMVAVRENEEGVSFGPELTSPAPPSSSAAGSGSRRWKDLFKKSSKEDEEKVESKKINTKRERKSGGGGHGGAVANSAELNINIWPFSRSRSAGNGGARTKVYTSRKVSSAPCSRSNSGGESKLRKWPASPGRAGAIAGVPVGRSSPVWQMRRAPTASVPRSFASIEASEKRKTGKMKGLKNCKQVASAAAAGLRREGSGGSNDGSGVVNLFSLRSLFSKKVY